MCVWSCHLAGIVPNCQIDGSAKVLWASMTHYPITTHTIYTGWGHVGWGHVGWGWSQGMHSFPPCPELCSGSGAQISDLRLGWAAAAGGKHSIDWPLFGHQFYSWRVMLMHDWPIIITYKNSSICVRDQILVGILVGLQISSRHNSRQAVVCGICPTTTTIQTHILFS